MALGNDLYVRNGGVHEDGVEKDGGHKTQNERNVESLSPNVDVENDDCHEAANRRIILSPKYNDQQVAMAEKLLSLKPIGLKLQNLSELVNKIEKNQIYTNGISHHPNNSHAKKMAEEKLKGCNFPAILLRIGSWEYVKGESRNEGDLMARCSYTRKMLVWEFLDKGLKNKIEIPWSDILAMRADIQETKPGILEIELSKPPAFYIETDPQPRKHATWQLTPDFTGGEASKWRRHFLQFLPGLLDKNYTKLLHYDSHLLAVSQIRFPSLHSPTFESNINGFHGYSLDSNVGGTPHLNDCPISGIPQQNFVQNQLHCQTSMQPTFYETPPLMSVQGVESIVNSTAALEALDLNVRFGRNYNLLPYDQTMEISQLDFLSEMQDQLLSDISQIGVYNNTFHRAREAPASSANESDQTSYGLQDIFSEKNLDFSIFDNAYDKFGSGFDHFWD